MDKVTNPVRLVISNVYVPTSRCPDGHIVEYAGFGPASPVDILWSTRDSNPPPGPSLWALSPVETKMCPLVDAEPGVSPWLRSWQMERKGVRRTPRHRVGKNVSHVKWRRSLRWMTPVPQGGRRSVSGFAVRRVRPTVRRGMPRNRVKALRVRTRSPADPTEVWGRRRRPVLLRSLSGQVST